MLKRVVAVLLILVLTMSGTAGASNAQEQRITREEPQETASLEGMTRMGNLQPPRPRPPATSSCPTIGPMVSAW